jgi:hypothetical protein
VKRVIASRRAALFLTLRNVIFIAAILLAMMQIAGTEKLTITDIVLDANGNPVARHRT